MTDPDTVRDIVRAMTEAHNDHDLEALQALLAHDFESHVPGIVGPLDRNGYIRGMDEAHAAFDELQFAIDEIIVEGDTAALRITATGRHMGEYAGIPPTGERVQFTGMAFRRVKDGKVQEEWQANDLHNVVEQLEAAADRM